MSKITPKYLALFTILIWPAGQRRLRLTDGDLSLGDIINACDLFALRVSLFAIIQLLTPLSSWLIRCSKSSVVGALTTKHVSSANKRGVLSIELDKSLIYNKKSSGPSVEP